MISGERKLKKEEYSFVERKLKDYRTSKQLIEEYERQREEILHSTHRKEAGIPEGEGIGMPTENKAIQMLQLEQKAAMERFWVRAIDDTMMILSPEDKRLVELRYFDGYLTNAGVARELSISSREYYRRRRKIMYSFAKRFCII